MNDFTLLDVELSITFARDKYLKAVQEGTDESLLKLMRDDIHYLEELKVELFSSEMSVMQGLVDEAYQILEIYR